MTDTIPLKENIMQHPFTYCFAGEEDELVVGHYWSSLVIIGRRWLL